MPFPRLEAPPGRSRNHRAALANLLTDVCTRTAGLQPAGLDAIAGEMDHKASGAGGVPSTDKQKGYIG